MGGPYFRAPLKRLLLALANRRTGPSPAARERTQMHLWGRVANDRGEEITMTMTVAEGYTFTMHSAIAAVERVLAAPRAGSFTPASLFGPAFVESIPGTRID